MLARSARRSVAALVAVVGVGCGSTPTRPEVPVASDTPAAPAVMLPLSGTWSGFLRVTACGSCIGYIDRVSPFTLTLTESGTTVTGHFAHGDILAFNADVQGVREPDGSVSLTGKTPASSSTFSADITNLRINRDTSHGVFGTLAYTDTSHSSSQGTYVAAIESAALGTPTAPTAVSLVGAWSGQTTRDSCTGPACGGSGQLQTPASAFQLVVLPGDPPRALLTFSPAISSHTSVELTGAVQPDGSTIFSGSAPPAGSQVEVGLYEVPLFHVRLNANGSLTGQWATRVSFGGYGTQVASGSIVSGSPVTFGFLPGSYQGAWTGALVIRGCTGECDLMRLGSSLGLRLDLSHGGGTVSGSVSVFKALFAVGPVVGNTATLTGTQTASYCGPDDATVVCAQTLRRMSTSLDPYGRMIGDVELDVDEWLGYGPRRRFTITGDLWSVIRP